MIPLHLKLSGFLSYHEPAEVDFTRFHLACISGGNGAGKSSLLDAITWVLFGQARKRDESLVNLQSQVAEVAFTFAYEGNIYRVQRALPRGKSGSLEFQVALGGDPAISLAEQEITWRPLTEHTARETQKRIDDTLRLDYETFINVSFFLQGKADQFTQQPASKRKEILGSILGLDQWDVYKERAAEQRKSIEREINSIDDRLNEITEELAKETERKQRLATLEAELKRLTSQYETQLSAVTVLRENRAALERQAEQVKKLAEDLVRKRGNFTSLNTRLEQKTRERDGFAAVLGRADEVQAAWSGWQAARLKRESWDKTASRFHEQEKRRQPFLDAISTAQAKLEQEREALGKEKTAAQARVGELEKLEQDLPTLNLKLQAADLKTGERAALEADLTTSREQSAVLTSTNKALKTEMEELDARMKELAAAEGAACPLCGQALSPEHRQSTLRGLKAEGDQKAESFRKNAVLIKELAGRIPLLEAGLTEVGVSDRERLRLAGEAAHLEGRLQGLRAQADDWQKGGAKRLPVVLSLLQSGDFAGEARSSLAQVDKELAALGYDAAAHDLARQAEEAGKGAEEEYRTLESARTAIKPLEDEVANLQGQIKELETGIDRQEKEHQQASSVLAGLQGSAPDLLSAETVLIDLQEQVNLKNQEVGGARQNVDVLDKLRIRQVTLTADRETATRQEGRYRTLERAFGKEGVPALLIEQALPEIETKANELLDRLSGGSMSVRFITQAAYKAKKREDLRETLDIQLSDGAGLRDYELYSGGEAFRANFAIRLALSEVLARRKGARLQMLVIDEGFGSQDEQGRQRLIQSIRAVQDDFARVLVITHLDELKDAFPTRIEVEKGEGGSRVRVI